MIQNTQYWCPSGPQPGGKPGNCPNWNFQKHVCLLDTTARYNLLPAENISWLRP